jgi:hypothetical protein
MAAWTESRLQKLFEEYNRRYWQGRLPVYRVRIDTSHRGAQCDRDERVIWMSLDCDHPRIILLHEMAHASPRRGSSGHGRVWQSEVERVVQLGAPAGLAKELACYRDKRALFTERAIVGECEDVAFETKLTWRQVLKHLEFSYRLSPQQNAALLNRCKKAFQRERRRWRDLLPDRIS